MLDKYLICSVSVAILLAVAINIAEAKYDVAKYCRLVPSGTKFPSFESCQYYSICNSNGTVTQASCTSSENFDKDTQKCVASASVSCTFGNECANKNNVFAGIANNCSGWFWCVNGTKAGSGNCPSGQLFNSTTLACEYGSCTASTEAEAEEIVNLCEIMQSGQYFGDLEACENWYICKKLVLQSGKCNKDNALLIYNTERRMCLVDDNSMCSRIPPAPFTPEAICNSSYIDGLVADPKVCSTYFECNLIDTWTKITCPSNQFFDVPTSTCLDRQVATPSVDCDRCQYSSSQWVNAVDATECRKYLDCKNGAMLQSGTCSEGQYFDEIRQGCVIKNVDLADYRLANGACAA